MSQLLATTRSVYDVEAVRRDFPILSRQVYGKPLIYLDNGASAQKPQAMLDALRTAYGENYANVHRGLHFLANASTLAYEGARETVRAFLNAPSLEEVIFTRSATGAINAIASSFGAKYIKEGDEIVLSIMEHHSNIVPWHFLRERKGAVIKWAMVREDGSFDIEAFEKLLTPRTKIVAITHMSNVLGTVTPMKEIVRMAYERGIAVLADGSQAAVHLDVDVHDLDVDFYVATGHKLYGPTGIGILYAKKKWLLDLPPFEGGGEMIRDVTMDGVSYGDLPAKFEAGTPPFAEAAGLDASLKYIMSIGRQAITAHEESLRYYAHEVLGGMKGIRIFGTAPGKGAIVSFNVEGVHAHDIATVLDRSGIAVRAGTHCAQPLLTQYNVTSTCRASFALYNIPAEINALAVGLEKAQKLFA
jgi:cysteine desulfurase/selenocysteine lyase